MGNWLEGKTLAKKIKEEVGKEIEISNVIIVEGRKDLPSLDLEEYSETEYRVKTIIYSKGNVQIIEEFYHKHHYYRDEYIDDGEIYTYNLYISTVGDFEVKDIMENYKKGFEEE